ASDRRSGMFLVWPREVVGSREVWIRLPPAMQRTLPNGSLLDRALSGARRRRKKLLGGGGPAAGNRLLVSRAGRNRSFEGIGEVQRLDDCARHLARRGEITRHGGADEQKVVVGGCFSGDATDRGVADGGAEATIGERPVVGDLPALGIHRRQDVVLQQP